MVDIDTHRVIELLASREAEDVAEWLRSYPDLEVVSRDGSAPYKSAIEQAGAHIQQVSDRFQLLKGLTDAAKKFISRLLAVNFTLPTEASHYDGKTTGDCWNQQSDRGIITFDYNNGLAEGSVNKLKVVKRIMYGRNSFELLKGKLLRLELKHKIN